MNLKYYLRGLGLGMLVTALILGLSDGGKETMTDAEIKVRARELGMIENTVLTDQEGQQEQETEAPEPGDADESSREPEQKEEAAAPGETQTDGTAKPGEDPGQHEGDRADETKAVGPEEKTGGSAGKPGPDGAETDAEAEGTPQASQDGDPMTGERTEHADVLTITQGDSSYSVAQKLFDMGMVQSVSEYDAFLCQNGYDRGIRAGTYEIEKGTTPEQIARMINGK